VAAARPPTDLTGYDSTLIMVVVPLATPVGGGQTARAIGTLEERQAEETPATVLRRPAEGPWPQASLVNGAIATLESIGFSAPLAAFYRRA
jgi:hypothetical protein